MFCTFLVVLSLLFSTTVLADVDFELQVDSAVVTLGDTFGVEVYVNTNGEEVRAAEIEILADNLDGEVTFIYVESAFLLIPEGEIGSSVFYGTGDSYYYAESITDPSFSNTEYELFATIIATADIVGDVVFSFNTLSAMETADSVEYVSNGVGTMLTIENSASSEIDSDGDGCSDSNEAIYGTNYLDANDCGELSCGQELDTSGYFLLPTGGLDCSAVEEISIEVSADDVVIDCVWETLVAPSSMYSAIVVGNQNNVQILNCVIEGGLRGILVAGGENNVISDTTLYGYQTDGIYLYGPTSQEVSNTYVCTSDIDGGFSAISCSSGSLVSGTGNSFDSEDCSLDTGSWPIEGVDYVDCPLDYSIYDGSSAECLTAEGVWSEPNCYDPNLDADGDGVLNIDEVSSCLDSSVDGLEVHSVQSDAPGCMLGDLDLDGDLDLNDLRLFTSGLDGSFGEDVSGESGVYAVKDLTEDGIFDFRDVLLFVTNYVDYS